MDCLGGLRRGELKRDSGKGRSFMADNSAIAWQPTSEVSKGPGFTAS